jgi:hypothetical protein
MAIGLRVNSGVSGRSRLAVLTTTSAPGRQMKLRPNASGCRVFTNAPTRHNGRPAATRRSQVSDNSAIGVRAERAP